MLHFASSRWILAAFYFSSPVLTTALIPRASPAVAMPESPHRGPPSIPVDYRYGHVTKRLDTSLNLFWFGGKDDQSKGKGSSSSGFGGVAPVMDSMENFKKSQQVGKMTETMLQELSSMRIEGSAADGKVRVYFDGRQFPRSVDVDDAYASSVPVDDLNSALSAALKDAYAKSREKMEEKMKAFYMELGLPATAADASS